MTDDDAMMKSILASPYDDTVRLAFADMIEEADRHDQAEYIRGSVRLGIVDKMPCDVGHQAGSDPACERCTEHRNLRDRLEKLLRVEWFGFDPHAWIPMSWNVIRTSVKESSTVVFNLDRGFPGMVYQRYRLPNEPIIPDLLVKMDHLPITYVEYNHQPEGAVGPRNRSWRWYDPNDPDRLRGYRGVVMVPEAIVPTWAFNAMERYYADSGVPSVAITHGRLGGIAEFADRMDAIKVLSLGVVNTYREKLGLPMLAYAEGK